MLYHDMYQCRQRVGHAQRCAEQWQRAGLTRLNTQYERLRGKFGSVSLVASDSSVPGACIDHAPLSLEVTASHRVHTLIANFPH